MNLFANKSAFIYLILTAGAAALILFIRERRVKKTLRLLFNRGNYINLIPVNLLKRRKLTDTLFLTGLFFMFFALAGPQWGREKANITSSFSQAVLALDVSTSMLAQDVKPNRIESAKLMVSMLVENLTNERLGIVAFTSQAFMQCPITTDRIALKNLAAGLSTNSLPVPGTSLSAAVKLSASMLASYNGRKALVLVTDGEDHSPQEVDSAVKAASENNVVIIAVGIGSTEGELIPIRSGGAIKEYKKDRNGKTVLTKLDEKSLMSLASATGGVYIKYTNAQQVSDEIIKQLSALDKSTMQQLQRSGYKDRYQIPLCLALLLILSSILIALRKIK